MLFKTLELLFFSVLLQSMKMKEMYPWRTCTFLNNYVFTLFWTNLKVYVVLFYGIVVAIIIA